MVRYLIKNVWKIALESYLRSFAHSEFGIELRSLLAGHIGGQTVFTYAETCDTTDGRVDTVIVQSIALFRIAFAWSNDHYLTDSQIGIEFRALGTLGHDRTRVQAVAV